MNNVKDYILNNEITFIITSPNTRTLSIINLLNELSIKDKYKAILFSFNISSNYYIQKLISFLSGISNNVITKYFYPCTTMSKCNKDKINRNSFIDSIEKIQNSKILMNCEKHTADNDYIDYVLNYSESDVLIIDNLYELLDKTKYSLDEIIRQVENKKDIHLVLFISARYKEKVMKEFNKEIRDCIFIDGYNYGEYKDININILNKIFKLRFNKMNQIMEEIDEGELCDN